MNYAGTFFELVRQRHDTPSSPVADTKTLKLLLDAVCAVQFQ
jgi:hypothetical protein